MADQGSIGVSADAGVRAAITSTVPTPSVVTAEFAAGIGARMFSPSGPRKTVSGTVQVNGAPVARTVRAYDRASGTLLSSATSSAVDGSFTLECLSSTEVYVVALTDETQTPDFNALIYDQVVPA